MTEPARQDLVEHVQEAPQPPALSETAAIIQVIERAALNPDVDVDKMERLLAMQERVMDRHAKMAFTEALAKMQPKLPVIDERGRIEVPEKNGKTGHSTPYAKWEDINDAIRPLLARHGFALTFRTGTADDGKIQVTGVLSHKAGHAEETVVTLMHDSSGSKNAVQAVGSSYSYGKRYAAIALLNITSRAPTDRDDDGVAAGSTDPMPSLRNMSEVAKRAISEINDAKDGAALALWKKNKSAGVAGMVTPAELKEIIALYNRRAAHFKAQAAAGSSDHQGDWADA